MITLVHSTKRTIQKTSFDKWTWIILALLHVLFLSSCTKEKTTQPEFKRVKRAFGVETGVSTTKTIGTTGGSITSADGNMKVMVPAGAVNTNTEFTIQPITSTLPGSKGTTYRLLPEGIHFNQPVTLQFSYDGINMQGLNKDVLYLSYQDKDGYYHLMTQTTRDAATKTLSVPTKHFSDWAIFAYVEVSPAKATIKKGTTARFTLTQSTLVEVSPITGELEIAEPVPYKFGNEVEWSKSAGGIGGLLVSVGAECEYTAPQTTGVQVINCTVNHVEVGGKNIGQIQFLVEVNVVDDASHQNSEADNFLELDVDGTIYNFKLVSGSFFDRSIITGWVSGEPYDPKQISINVNSPAVINKEFGYDDLSVPDGVQIDFGPGFAGDHLRTDYRDCSLQKIRSGGRVKFTKVGAVGDFVEGHFTCTGYGSMTGQCPTPNLPRTIKTIKGKFKIYRGF